MSTFKFQNKYYNSDQGWGLFHPEYNYWYDPSCINITKSDVAILDISNNTFDVKKFGAGQMVSKRHYLYGKFEWEYILPKGKNLWPAIWLTAVGTWPPEIDVMEGWTSRGYFNKNRSDYRKFIGFNNIVPGLVYGTYPDTKGYSKASLGTKTTFSCLQPLNKVNKCTLEWYPHLIRMCYNGYMVSEITDENILKEFNIPMMVIMNNAVTKDFKESDYDDYKKNGRPFSIINFNYSNYEN